MVYMEDNKHVKDDARCQEVSEMEKETKLYGTPDGWVFASYEEYRDYLDSIR